MTCLRKVVPLPEALKPEISVMAECYTDLQGSVVKKVLVKTECCGGDREAVSACTGPRSERRCY